VGTELKITGEYFASILPLSWNSYWISKMFL